MDATFYQAIRAVAPGDILIADAAGARASSYWRLEPGRELEFSSEAEYVETLWDLLHRVTAEYSTPNDFGVALSGVWTHRPLPAC